MAASSILAAALAAILAPEAGPTLAELPALEEALNDLEKCRGLTGPACAPPLRRYTVHKASCGSIPPEGGRPSIVCRVDETLTYAEAGQETTRYRDQCVRFARSDGSGGATRWTVLQIRDRPCELPSALKGDPHPVPERAELERALVAAHKCYDPDGLIHCGGQPDRAPIRSFRCRPATPGPEGQARAACRVTGEVTGWRGRTTARLNGACVRLERLTPAEQSPAHWYIDDFPDKRRCAVR